MWIYYYNDMMWNYNQHLNRKNYVKVKSEIPQPTITSVILKTNIRIISQLDQSMSRDWTSNLYCSIKSSDYETPMTKCLHAEDVLVSIL